MNKDVFNLFPVLQLSNGLTLREFKHTDAQDLMSILSHPKVAPFIPQDVIPSTISDALQEVNFLKGLFARQQSIYWAIANSENQLIGSAGFEMWNHFHNRLELAFELHPDYWRQGIMKDTLYTICDYAFDIMKANRIEAFTIESNDPSVQILQKVGFEKEGTLRKYRKFQGEYVDIFIFSKISPHDL